jgi:hypothetical protein
VLQIRDVRVPNAERAPGQRERESDRRRYPQARVPHVIPLIENGRAKST